MIDTRARRQVIVLMLVAIALDQSSGPATAPAIGAAGIAFALDARASAWLTMSFNIGYLAAIVVSIWAIARFGKRRYLTASLAGYAISSLACALAPNPKLFVAARVLGGASAGGFFTSGLLTIVGTAPKRDLPLTMVVFSAVMLLAPTVAPLYAGVVLEQTSWRAVFAGLALPAFAGALLVRRSMRDVGAGRAEHFDTATFCALVFGLASFQFLINAGATVHWLFSSSVVFAVGATAGAIALYALRELRTSRAPFLDLRVLRLGLPARGLAAGVSLGVLLAGVSLEAQFAQREFSLGPAASGALIAIRGVGIALGVVAVAYLTGRGVAAWCSMTFGLCAIGATCVAQGLAIAREANLTEHVAIGIIAGAAFAFVLGPLATVLFNAVDHRSFASLVVLFKLSALVGSGFALAIVATALDRSSPAGVMPAGTYSKLWYAAAALSLATAALTATLRSSTAGPKAQAA